jgi:hypothetical protein
MPMRNEMNWSGLLGGAQRKRAAPWEGGSFAAVVRVRDDQNWMRAPVMSMSNSSMLTLPPAVFV